jgi:VanZ family protein
MSVIRASSIPTGYHVQAERFLFWLAASFATSMALLPKPPHLPIDRFGDKFAHGLAFLVITVLAQLAFTQSSRWRVAERLSFFGALIEVAQSIPALQRDSDIRDWMVDTLAVLVATVIFVVADALRRGEPAASRG